MEILVRLDSIDESIEGLPKETFDRKVSDNLDMLAY